MSPTAVSYTILAHHPEFDGQLTWITKEEIDGYVFQSLTMEDLQALDVHLTFGKQKKLLQMKLNNPKALLQSSLSGQDMRNTFAVNKFILFLQIYRNPGD